MKEFNIFISHAWEYNDDYYRLEEMLNDAENFKWKNYSVPKHDSLDTATDDELIDALINQIQPTHIVIILSGMYSVYRDWMQIEMEIAEKLKKPLLGIVPWGQERIPQDVQDVVDDMVGWNTISIVDAITKNSF